MTAGCSGLGKEFTRCLLKKGAEVYPTTRNIENAKEFLNELSESERENCNPIELKYDSEKDIDLFVDKFAKEVGSVYALVNSAVCRDPINDVIELDVEKWKRHYEVNVFLTTILSCKVAETLIKENGRIVNISSFYSKNVPDNRVYDDGTIPTSLIYASSKAALNYVTQYLAVYYAEKGITVNAILAGGVENNQRQSAFFQREYKKRVPMKRMGGTQEFNEALAFFLSEANKYCTGELLSIDGGWNLW